MTRILKKMPTPQGIGAGQTASVNLPLGLTYERFYFRANVDGTPRDLPASEFGNYVTEVRLIVDGDAKITIAGADLYKLNGFYGLAMVAGSMPLALSRPWMRTINGEDQTGYGTGGGMGSFTLELDLAAGKTFNSVNVYAEQSAGRRFGPHLRIQRFSHTQGVTGEGEIADIPRGPYAMLALHIGTAAIAGVEVHADQRKVHDSDEVIRDQRHKVVGRTPQANMTHIDFLTENRLAEALPMALQDFRLKLDFTGTGNHWIYAESLQGAA